MNQTDKAFIESKLLSAISLVSKDQTASALREIADAVSVVAVALESQTSGAHSMTLNEDVSAAKYQSDATRLGFHTHFHDVVKPLNEPGSIDHAAVTRQIQEQSALASVKPLCLSGLLATLSGVSVSKNPQCPACGLFHDRRVVVVELSSLGLHMLKHEGAIRIGGGDLNPDKYRQDDRIIFTENSAPLKGDVILGDVVKMFSGPYGREASIQVVKS